MPWTQPKTDWKVNPPDEFGRYNGDWFNWQDHDRIRENIEYLAEMSFARITKIYSVDEMVVMYPEYTGYTSGMALTDKLRYAAPVIVDLQINTIESALDILPNYIFRPSGYGSKRTWVQNGATPTFRDLNRWENNISLLKIYMDRINEYSPKLPFNMNGRRF